MCGSYRNKQFLYRLQIHVMGNSISYPTGSIYKIVKTSQRGYLGLWWHLRRYNYVF